MSKFYSALLLIVACLTFTVSMQAAAFQVNTFADTLDATPGDGTCADAGGSCSLRAAVGEANALGGADVISLPPGRYIQTLVAPHDDANAGGDWDVTSEMTINGSGEFSCALQAAAKIGTASERVLNVRPGGNLTLSRVTVRYGNFSGALNDSTRGAGIENRGVLDLDGVIVSENLITSNTADPVGAGIYNAGGALTMNSSTISFNQVVRQSGGNVYGGGIASTSGSSIAVTNAYIGNNSAIANGGSAYGGGLYLDGSVTTNITGTAIVGNSCSSNGTYGCGVSAVSNAGPAVFSAFNSNFRNNSNSGSAAGQGIGLYFQTAASSEATLSASLNRVTIKDNAGVSSGVGIAVAVNGGQLDLDIRNSSLTNNAGGVVGGAIFVTDAGPGFGRNAVVDITNTTISANFANNAGGGLMVQGTRSTANLDHVTVAGNFADNCGGVCNAAGTVTIRNSVISDNIGGAAPDIAGEIASGDYNHFENISGAAISGAVAHNATGDAQLGSLVEYAGGTVHVPVSTSPVINSIPAGTNGCGTEVTDDQRSVPRPSGNACDKGAVERSISASLSGRVIAADGRGVRGALVTIFGGGLSQPRQTYTTSFGFYSFPDLPGEERYNLTAVSKRLQFKKMFSAVYLYQDTSDLNFVAWPEF